MMGTVAGAAVRGAVVGQQRGGTGVDHQGDRAAVPAVAAVGTARSHIFLPVKSNRTVAAVACFNIYFSYIYEHFFLPFLTEITYI